MEKRTQALARANTTIVSSLETTTAPLETTYKSVYALACPPDMDRYFSYSCSSGNFCDPMDIMCSVRCANPGKLSGSCICPTRQANEAADLSALGSEIIKQRKPFCFKRKWWYLRRSVTGSWIIDVVVVVVVVVITRLVSRTSDR